MDIPIFNTYIDKNSFSYVKKVLQSTYLSEGKLVQEFEEKISSDFGVINPVAVNSGTSALHLALVLEGIKHGDEVIIPAQTFIATGLVVSQTGAKPVFADIQYETGNICPKSIEEKITPKTKAIIVVHWGGYPCDMDKISAISKKHKIPVIEDAAHAFGATFNGKPIGTLSDYTCFSFQAIKHVTTGDGGIICCRNTKKYNEAKKLRWFGIDRKNSKPSILGERKYDVKQIGYKYHMNDYAAALGIANILNYKQRLEKRIKIAKMYSEELKNIPEIQIFTNTADRQSAFWLFGMHVKYRNKFILHMKKKGITTSVVHLGIDHNSIFSAKQGKLINQRKFDKTQIHIPIHDQLNNTQIKYIINSIKEFFIKKI